MCERAESDVRTIPELILIRHGEVASHRGDIPLTRAGRTQAEQAGRRLAGIRAARAWILVGPTVRSHQTGLIALHGWTSANTTSDVVGPTVTMALRNPDLYLAGQRVDMVSSAAAFAQQATMVTARQVTDIGFYSDFLTSADRIGYWLHHANPPGDTAAAVADRIRQFAFSLAHLDGTDLVVGITQSPVLRAVGSHFAGLDPGEPGYLDGYRVRLRDGGALALSSVDWNQADPA